MLQAVLGVGSMIFDAESDSSVEDDDDEEDEDCQLLILSALMMEANALFAMATYLLVKLKILLIGTCLLDDAVVVGLNVVGVVMVVVGVVSVV